MKINVLSGVILLLALVTAAAGTTNDATTLLQKGLFEEEANHNLGAAIQLYQNLVAQFDKDRKLAATAVFRLGECYRKQGNTNEAISAYHRVLNEFPDQEQLVSVSRQNVLALGGTSAAAAQVSPAPSNAGRQEQKRLLEQEVRLVEQQLALEQKRVQSGVSSSESLLPIQRDLLTLKRQIAALDAAEPVVKDLLTEVAPATSAEAEEVKRIQAMIRDSPDLINAPDVSSGVARYTPLIKAAMNGQLVVAQFLVRAGADLESKDSRGCTALYWAAYQGHKGMVELLLSSKAQPNNANIDGRTPLHAAAERGFRTVAEVLIDGGANVNAADNGKATALHLAVVNSFRSVTELLLDKGANVNAEAADMRTQGRVFTGTALLMAASRGDVTMTELLLKRKANPELLGAGGATPLQAAASGGYLEVAKALLANGARVDARNTSDANRNWTALHYATVSGRKEIVELLLNNKADPNAAIETGFSSNTYGAPSGRSGSGYTPLLMATAKGYTEIVQLLLAAKADPNAKSATGDTPIINAMTMCAPPERANILTLLLARGASPEATDPEGNTALLLSTEKKDKQSLELLLEHKANPNARNRSGYTALHLLAYKLMAPPPYQDLLPMVSDLIGAKADVNAQSPKDGRTPLKILGELLSRIDRGSEETIKQFAELLRKAGAVEDLPQLDRIEVARPAANWRETVFWKATNDYNNFTLFELVAVEYGMMIAPERPQSPVPGGRPVRLGAAPPGMPAIMPGQSPLGFPDLSRVVIRRATPDGKSRNLEKVQLSNIFEQQKCEADIQLKWGDVVEIPEADHPINANWTGLPERTSELLIDCLTRNIQVRVKDQSTNMVLKPLKLGFAGPRSFTLMNTLNASGMLRASSDLSRVKVTRHDKVTSQSYQMELSAAGAGSDLWLRDGDVIEVPEKP